jgi:hypothetical protein
MRMGAFAVYNAGSDPNTCRQHALRDKNRTSGGGGGHERKRRGRHRKIIVKGGGGLRREDSRIPVDDTYSRKSMTGGQRNSRCTGHLRTTS